MQPKEIYAQTTRYFLKPILPLMDDEEVTEVMINGPNAIFFERKGKVYPAEGVSFPDEASLYAAAQNIAEYVGRRLDAETHSMDGRLPEGHRVHAIIPPAAKNGVTITIRKFKASRITLQDLVGFGSLTDEAAEFLRDSVAGHKNLVISGGTGTGKTSLLNALSACISETERIIVIEDTSELKLTQAHTIYLEAQPPKPNGRSGITIRDLFVDSLRMRPDRIIVGEVRRGEALDLIQSMISGHSGALTTVHANSPYDAAIRLETLCLMSDVELPQIVARMQVASAIDLVVQIERVDGVRRVSKISLSDKDAALKTGKYTFNHLFDRNPQGILVRT